jgi:hypothetical protein
MAIQIANKEQQLANLEKIIKQNEIAGMKALTEVKKYEDEIGKALTKIRDGKLYPQHTFEQYCLQNLGYKRAYAYRLCRAFETKVQLLEDSKKSTNSEIVDNLPVSQTNEIAKVPESQRIKVLKDAKKKGKITAKSIKETASKIDVIEKDKTGYPIPTPAMAIWNRREEVKSKLRPLQELRQWAEDMQGSDDPLFAEITFSNLKLDIEAVIMTLNSAVPYGVCPLCQGQAPQTCTFCKGRGMVSKFLYTGVAVPEEMKQMREKIAQMA